MAGDGLDLSGRLVLISGGAGSLGVAVVERLRRHGARLAVVDLIDEGEGSRRLAVDDQVRYYRGDCSDPDMVRQLLAECERDFGCDVDTVCCHAGIVESYPIHEYPLDRFDAVLNANLRGAFVLAQAASLRWIARGTPGLLVFTSSWVQDVPWPGIAPYSATKAAVRSLTRSFARELAPHAIRANAVAPGIAAVGMARRQWDTEPEYRARAERAIPLGHLQPPESIADAFLFLISPMAQYMTGSVLVVDGGASLYPMD